MSEFGGLNHPTWRAMSHLERQAVADVYEQIVESRKR